MTPPLIDRWISIIETGRTDDLDALLADDAVFYSPAVYDIYVNGIDMIHWNDDEQIVSFKVMLRPLKGLQAIMPAMAELLQQ
jgi:hypothetical protein